MPAPLNLQDCWHSIQSSECRVANERRWGRCGRVVYQLFVNLATMADGDNVHSIGGVIDSVNHASVADTIAQIAATRLMEPLSVEDWNAMEHRNCSRLGGWE